MGQSSTYSDDKILCIVTKVYSLLTSISGLPTVATKLKIKKWAHM